MRAIILVIVCCAIHCIAGRSDAASTISLLTSAASLSNPDVVDWSQFGSAGTAIPQPFQATTSRGYKLTVLKNNSTTPYVRADQGNGFTGDFSPGQKLLFSTSQTAFDFRFNPPVTAIGGQIQHERSGVWTPYIVVFTTSGETFTFQPADDVNNQAANGTAPFYGVTSTTANISRVLFDSYYGGNTAMGALSLAVPEPASGITLAGLGIAAAARRRSQRNRRGC